MKSADDGILTSAVSPYSGRHGRKNEKENRSKTDALGAVAKVRRSLRNEERKFHSQPPPSPLKRTEIAKQASTFETSTVGNLLQKRVHVLPALLNVVGHLRDNRSLVRW